MCIRDRLYRQSELVDEKDEDQEAAVEDLLQRVQASGDVDKDLRVLYWQEPEDLAAMLLDQMAIDMAEDAGVDRTKLPFHKLWDEAFNWRPEYAQILSPYRGELFGIEALNVVIQKEKSAALLGRVGALDGITLFDKVIQIRNRTASDLSLIHISEHTRPYSISYAVFCLKKTTMIHHASYIKIDTQDTIPHSY